MWIYLCVGKQKSIKEYFWHERVLLAQKNALSQKVCFKLEKVLCLSVRSEIKIVFDSII